jgi:lipid-A-disaccharide synthase
VAYRFSRTTAFIVRALRLVRARYFSQPNLLADRMLVPELLQEQVTPERLAGELDAWLADPARVAAVTEEFRALHAVLRRDAGARAADAVLGVLGARGAGRG